MLALGVDLGDKLLLPSRDNPKGYFEHSELMSLNISFLNAYHLDNDGLLGELPTDWVYSEKAIDRITSFEDAKTKIRPKN